MLGKSVKYFDHRFCAQKCKNHCKFGPYAKDMAVGSVLAEMAHYGKVVTFESIAKAFFIIAV